ncbi:MAG TPA: hypothetical protein VFD58_31810 [Blastocatellia bacterium]|nr:hypothetical protein [Blastocatellia bacterium]
MMMLLGGGLLALGLRKKSEMPGAVRKSQPGSQFDGELNHYLATRERLCRRLRAKIGDRTQ